MQLIKALSFEHGWGRYLLPESICGACSSGMFTTQVTWASGVQQEHLQQQNSSAE